MKSVLHNISITNYKAFNFFEFNAYGRNLLVYGANGSGKSSIYWSIHAFLESASKSKNEISKYFDLDNGENLLNIYEEQQKDPRPGAITVTLRDIPTRIDTTYYISKIEHSTFNQPIIINARLASNFITYRFFFEFSRFKNSEEFNIWPLFKREILPFCKNAQDEYIINLWEIIYLNQENPPKNSGIDLVEEQKQNIRTFHKALLDIVIAINIKAQELYDKNFSENDTENFIINLAVLDRSKNQTELNEPAIVLSVQIGNKKIEHPQTFLNEAKLTQLALSIRLAAILTNLIESDLKLLILDDLLISLDMSNRMKVVNILLSSDFIDYQKIILTHDLGFFREFRRNIDEESSNWCFVRLQGNAATNIQAKNEKNDLEMATDYINRYEFEEAAVRLRKSVEDMIKRFLYWFNKNKEDIYSGKYISLFESLNQAKNQLEKGIPINTYNKIIKTLHEKNHLKYILPTDKATLEAFENLEIGDKNIIIAKRRELSDILTNDNWEKLEAIELIDKVGRMTERVLNPAAHNNIVAPLYEDEVRRAEKVIRRLQEILKSLQTN